MGGIGSVFADPPRAVGPDPRPSSRLVREALIGEGHEARKSRPAFEIGFI
jgi:hypothetical protein